VRPHYALNNFNKAFRALVNQGSGKRRWLCSKYVQHLCDLEISDMPDLLRERFTQFKQEMEEVRKSCQAKDFRHAVQLLDESRVIEVAAHILKMHEMLIHETSVDLLTLKMDGSSG
jgi:DNA-binding MurR/RpiR family transcriptional regulator